MTTQEIYNEIIAEKSSGKYKELDELNSTSKSSIWRLMVFVFAYFSKLLQDLFVLHKKHIDAAIRELKPHTVRWYKNKALSFQYGFDLKENSDEFNNEGYTEEQIEESKVVKYAAIVESVVDSRIIIKIATEVGGFLTPVSNVVLSAFKDYILTIKDAGVKTTIISYMPDLLKLRIRIVRDVLVLDNEGKHRIDGNYPVRDSIQLFVKNLPFNGELSIQSLVDTIQAAEGVLDLAIDSIQSAWLTGAGYGEFEDIDISEIAVSGYFSVNFTDDNNTLSVITYD